MIAQADRGVVLALIGSGTSLSYLTGNAASGGVSGVPRISYSGVFRASDTFYPGRAQNTSITVAGLINTGPFGVEVAVERLRLPGINSGSASGIPVWSRVSTVRLDNQAYSGNWGAPMPSQTITRLNMSGAAVDTSSGTIGSGSAAMTLGVVLTTTDLVNAKDGARVIARATSGAFGSGDYVLFSVDCA